MKILLVDDELHVIRAIRQLVPWEDLNSVYTSDMV